MIEVMVEGGEIGHSSGSAISGGEFVISSVPSLKVSATGSGVYRGPLQYSFVGGDAAGFVSKSVVTVIPQTIAPTASKTGVEGQAPLRLGDAGTLSAIGTIDPPATPPTGPVVGPVEVTDAGQYKVFCK